jgi:hypothetical protein
VSIDFAKSALELIKNCIENTNRLYREQIAEKERNAVIARKIQLDAEAERERRRQEFLKSSGKQ